MMVVSTGLTILRGRGRRKVDFAVGVVAQSRGGGGPIVVLVLEHVPPVGSRVSPLADRRNDRTKFVEARNLFSAS